jgi:hypothetical protein
MELDGIVESATPSSSFLGMIVVRDLSMMLWQK